VVSKSGCAAFRAVSLCLTAESYFKIEAAPRTERRQSLTTWERLSERHSLSARKAAEPLTAYRLLTTDY